MKVLGIGTVLRSEFGTNYYVESITKKLIRLRSEHGGFVEFTLRGFEDALDNNMFIVGRVFEG